MADAADLTNQFNTALSPEQEAQYLAWVQSLPEGQRSTYDYDLRGAFLAGAGRAGNGHFPDTFKKPNHPTFSSESQYSTGPMTGGKWVDIGGGKWAFQASPVNLQYRSPDALVEYFKTVEPGSQVMFPHGVTPSFQSAFKDTFPQ